MGGYWGTVVVARPQGLLVDQDGISGFGYQHHWLRELGDGWQLVETRGIDEPPDLLVPSAAVAASTGHPVLAAYVSDSYCAAMCTALPGEVGPLTHLWDVGGPCGVYRHAPWEMPEPAGRTVDEVVAELTAWSAAAGLTADAAALRAIVGLGEDADGQRRDADDLLFDLVKALGVARIGRTLPWSLPVDKAPFSKVTDLIAMSARVRAAERRAYAEDGEAVEPAEPWETDVIALDDELWASLYRTQVDVVALARRTAEAWAAHDARNGRFRRSVDDWCDSVVARFVSELPRMTHNIARPEVWNSRRGWADSRATE